MIQKRKSVLKENALPKNLIILIDLKAYPIQLIKG
jgi:hypothetical protein